MSSVAAVDEPRHSPRVAHRVAVRHIIGALLAEEQVARLSIPPWGLELVFVGCDPEVVAPLLTRLRAVARYGVDFHDGAGYPFRGEDAPLVDAELQRLTDLLLDEYQRAMARIYAPEEEQ